MVWQTHENKGKTINKFKKSVKQINHPTKAAATRHARRRVSQVGNRANGSAKK